MNIHNLLNLFKDYFHEASHEMIALRSFNLPSESGSALPETRSLDYLNL
jgi:hypothetical protein